ncbi:hypothetical protein M8818_007151 [Zalaria obscura]|uniref:Uncharacterized protein n=1 Tax=Zalaria obscura TaxID=2024903 RepID=A0ACC3S580_9PEZI
MRPWQMTLHQSTDGESTPWPAHPASVVCSSVWISVSSVVCSPYPLSCKPYNHFYPKPTINTHQRKSYGLDGLNKVQQANLSANIVSTLQVGCFVGSLVASYVADKLGRRTALLISAVIVCIGCIFQAASLGHVAVMYIGRFIAGLGVGAASMVTPLYCAENSPRAIRGGLTGLYQLFIACGTMLAFWTNYGSLLHLHGNNTYSESHPRPALRGPNVLAHNASRAPLRPSHPRRPPLRLHVPLQRIQPLARQSRQMGRRHFRPLNPAPTATRPPLHPRRTARHRRATRARAPPHRRQLLPRPAERNVENPRQPQASPDQHRADGVPADDRHERHQLLRTPDLRRAGHLRHGNRPLRNRHLRRGKNDHLRRLPPLRRRLARPPQIPPLDLHRAGLRNVLRRSLRADFSSRRTRRRAASRLRGAGLHLPVRGVFPVRVGTVLLDLRERDPDGKVEEYECGDCGGDAVVV